MSKAFDTGGAIPDDDSDDQTQNQQVAGNIPTKPAGPGGDQPSQNPFPTQTPAVPFGKLSDNQNSPRPIQPMPSKQGDQQPKPFNPRDYLPGAQGAIPDSSGDQVASLDDALNTVDSVMQFGYQQAGANMNGDQGSTAMAEGGAVPDPSTPLPTKLPPVEDDHAIEMNQLSTTAARAAAANVRKRSSGTMAYDDGGAVDDQQGAIPDDQGDQAPQQSQDQTGAAPAIQAQANQQTQGAGQAPQQKVQKLVGLVQGAGAMPTQQAQALEAQSGEDDPNVAKIMTVHNLAQQGGPQAAWSYVQSLRKQYDLARTAAAVKANQGQLPQSTQAANIAMTNVLDGTDTKFTPSANGKSVVMTVHKVGAGAAKKYDEGGAVDANGNDDEGVLPTAPANATPNTPEAEANDQSFNQGAQQLGHFVLSIPQYVQALMGKAFQFDQVYNNGSAGAGKQAQAQAPEESMIPQGGGAPAGPAAPAAPPQAPPLQGQGASNPMMQGGLPGVGEGNYGGEGASFPNLKRFGSALAANAGFGNGPPPLPPQGTTQATPPQPAGSPAATPQTPPPQSTPQPPNRPWSELRGGASPAEPGETSQYETNGPGGGFGPFGSSRKDLVRIYGEDAVRAAEIAHPMIGDQAARTAMLTNERNEAQKAKYQQQNTSIITQGRVTAAEARVQGLMGVQQLKSALSDSNSARKAATEIQVAAMRLGTAEDANLARIAVGMISSGQLPPDAMMQQISRMMQRSQGAGENQQGGQQQAPRQQDFTQKTGVQQGQQVQKGGQYYLVNKDGIVTQGPSATPFQ